MKIFQIFHKNRNLQSEKFQTSVTQKDMDDSSSWLDRVSMIQCLELHGLINDAMTAATASTK